jgi:hypothetical protein
VLAGDTTSLTIGSSYFSSVSVDEIQFTGNLVIKGAIFTTGALMLGIGNANVSIVGTYSGKSIPAANVVVQADSSCTVLAIDRATLGVHAGQSIYYSQAVWNQATYNSSGLAGLSWTDWKILATGFDSTSALTGNIRHTVTSDNKLNLTTSNGNILAFGATTTKIANSWATYSSVATIPFSTNTVMLDDKPTGDVFQYPGIVAGVNPLNGAADLWLNWRFMC